MILECKVTESYEIAPINSKFAGKHSLIRDIEETKTIYDFEIDEKVKKLLIKLAGYDIK